jgi:hypothetical protein
MPDKRPQHQLFLKLGTVQVGVIGLPAIFVVFMTLIGLGRLWGFGEAGWLLPRFCRFISGALDYVYQPRGEQTDPRLGLTSP